MCQSALCVASFVQLFLGSLDLQGQSASWHRTPSLVVLPNGGALVTFCLLISTPRVVLVHWFLLWLPFLRLSGLFRSLHISPQSEPSFDSALEDSTHIADSLDPESPELLYESSFGARISVCRLSSSRRFPSQDSEFYSFWTRDVLFGFLRRFLFDMGHPGLKLRWSPLIKVFTGYENDGPLHWLMNDELFPLCFPLSCSQYVHFGYHILQISSTVQTTLMYQELLITSLMDEIYWICVQSILVYDNDRPRGNNVGFFFLMSISNVDFQCCIFNVYF